MVNLDDFRYGGTNITAFRLLDPERDEVKQVVQDWIFGEMRYGRKMEAHEQTIKVIHLYPSINKQTNIIYKVFCL
jgi:ionotropic kainate glutamate receptor 2